MRNKRHIPVILLFVVLCCRLASAQSGPAEGAQQFASLGEFKLQSGAVIRDFRIGYRTLGKLNAVRSNAVFWSTWLGGRSADLLPLVGPGNVVDTGRYFVVLLDSIGDGVSSSPSTSQLQPLMKFPEFSIRDMVESQHRLATEVLHLSHLRAVLGISMGAMQAFEWAAVYPNFMDEVVCISGSPQSTSYDKLLWSSAIDAIELDPAWNQGHPTGLLRRGPAVAAQIELMNETSPEYRVTHTPPEGFGPLRAQIEEISKLDGGGASDEIRQRQAIVSLDLPAELGLSLEQVAGRARAKMLIIVSSQDHMVNPAPAMRFAKAIGSPVISVDSPCGHLSFACVSVGPVVSKFLADPASVSSETLR
jgi:homoserine acetyltransferase